MSLFGQSSRPPAAFMKLAALASLLAFGSAGLVNGQDSADTQKPAPENVDSAASTASGGTLTKVSKGDGVLPNGHGQIWREYDISPYTNRVTSTARPEWGRSIRVRKLSSKADSAQTTKPHTCQK